MATYQELYDLADNNILIDRVAVAVVIAAVGIAFESDQTANHVNRVKWAKQAFDAPREMAKSFLFALLAANAAATVAQIQGATDATIQTHVDNVVNVFAGG